MKIFMWYLSSLAYLCSTKPLRLGATCPLTTESSTDLCCVGWDNGLWSTGCSGWHLGKLIQNSASFSPKPSTFLNAPPITGSSPLSKLLNDYNIKESSFVGYYEPCILCLSLNLDRKQTNKQTLWNDRKIHIRIPTGHAESFQRL